MHGRTFLLVLSLVFSIIIFRGASSGKIIHSFFIDDGDTTTYIIDIPGA